jgi:hypothetical protein
MTIEEVPREEGREERSAGEVTPAVPKSKCHDQGGLMPTQHNAIEDLSCSATISDHPENEIAETGIVQPPADQEPEPQIAEEYLLVDDSDPVDIEISHPAIVISVTLPPDNVDSSPFICSCENEMRKVCAGEQFYKECDGNRYCVFHYPGQEKVEDFETALEKKIRAKDFNFRGVWFPKGISLGDYRFEPGVDFSKAIFSDEAVFDKVYFRGTVDFQEATFSGEARFNGTHFGDVVDFQEANFLGTVSFQGARFGASKFQKTNFSAAANFMVAWFHNAAYFTEVKFNADANFDGSHFLGNAEFSRAKFCKGAQFRRASFSQEAKFNEAGFDGLSHFTNITFDWGALFGSASFSTGPCFSNSTFKGVADFTQTNFTRGADFITCIFKSFASFNRTDFGSDAEFINAKFESDVTFSYARFNATADFNNATFEDHAYFTGTTEKRTFGAHPVLDFINARFEKSERVSFHTLDLRPHWFVNVDPRKFEFIDVEFKIGLKEELKSLKEDKVGAPHRLLAIAYRQLADNAEANHRYREASRLRYATFEARRIERFYGFVPWRLDWWYWLVSGYGEKALQAVAVLIALWAFFAVGYTMTGFESRTSQNTPQAAITTDEVGEPLSFKRALTYSLGVMSLQKPKPEPVTNTAKSLVTVEAILGPLQAALLALAIRFMR